MLTVATVLRSGGVYTAEWVDRLQRQVARHVGPHRFVCLSDVDVPCERVHLEYRWAGWWSKMELFRPNVFFGPVLFFDLDTLIVGDISDVAGYRGGMAMILDFLRPDQAQSGVMAWTPGPLTDRIWDTWIADPGRWMREWSGDGDVVRELAGAPDILQELYPGAIGSYKVDGLVEGPCDHRVVCFHGSPKPSDFTSGWVADAWLG